MSGRVRISAAAASPCNSSNEPHAMTLRQFASSPVREVVNVFDLEAHRRGRSRPRAARLRSVDPSVHGAFVNHHPRYSTATVELELQRHELLGVDRPHTPTFCHRGRTVEFWRHPRWTTPSLSTTRTLCPRGTGTCWRTAESSATCVLAHVGCTRAQDSRHGAKVRTGSRGPDIAVGLGAASAR